MERQKGGDARIGERKEEPQAIYILYADPSPTWRGSEETIVGAATVALEIRSSVQPMFVDRVEINDIQARVALLIPFTGPRKLPA